jgi:hypothetical protein
VFGEFNGLPVHALVVHAAVVFTPLAALLGLGLWFPEWRMALRWPLVAVTAIAAVTVYVAKQSGNVLQRALGDQIKGNATADVLDRHIHAANRLWIALLIYLVIVLAVALLLPRLNNHLAAQGLALIAAVSAIAVMVLVVQTGDAGAKARWNPDGSVDYSGN